MTTTLIIIIITVIISITAFNNDKIINDLIFWPPQVKHKHQYYRFITSGFIHADLAHLAFNMITFYFFGRVMEGFFEMKMGSMGFLLFYLGGIVVSEIPSYIRHQDNYHYRSLGASGGVTAVLFSFILLAPWQTLYVFFLPLPAIVFAVLYFFYTAYMSKRGGDYINHSAHLWGAIYGVVFTILVERGALEHFLRELMRPQFNL
ncbi:MAG TPA: rhomboid family intramembrane serine protease [Lacibacter sp.]|nr:rhomboid family intramembrane serine protease [Lacibacter sp.]HMO90238.1 rhomboid family intramembrane serine protease [Lacibacter sp.]HMP88157.1 rhomboid family intramembrane serine protease [Lacibacter sp.]